jgi:hypothetical protein
MSMIGGFFKKQKHSTFEYKPRYWDPEKEDLEQRIKTAKGEVGSDPDAIKRRISKSMRRGQRSSYRHNRGANKRSTILLLGIIIALAALSYYMLTVYLPQLEQLLN